MEKKEMTIRELEDGLRDAIKGLNNRVERADFLVGVLLYTVFMEEVRKMPLLVRLNYWKATFVVFNYLRTNHQLGRTVGEYDPIVENNLKYVIGKLMYENV